MKKVSFLLLTICIVLNNTYSQNSWNSQTKQAYRNQLVEGFKKGFSDDDANKLGDCLAMKVFAKTTPTQLQSFAEFERANFLANDISICLKELGLEDNRSFGGYYVCKDKEPFTLEIKQVGDKIEGTFTCNTEGISYQIDGNVRGNAAIFHLKDEKATIRFDATIHYVKSYNNVVEVQFSIIEKFVQDGCMLDELSMITAPKTKMASPKSPQKMIAKVWYVDVDKLELPAELQEQLKVHPEIMNKMKEGMKSITFEFKADGTCSFASPDGKENRTGTWKISGDGKSLTIIDDNLKIEEVTPIISLTNNELVMDLKGMKLHLKP